MNNIVIRHATQEDALLLAKLNRHVQEMHAAAVPTLFKPHSLVEMEESFRTRLLSKKDFYILIADEDATPVGYLSAQIMIREENPYTYAQRWLSIDEIGVLPAHQGRGVGQALAQAVLTYAKEQEIMTLTAGIWYFNNVSKAFFRTLGFVQRQEQVWLHLE